MFVVFSILINLILYHSVSLTFHGNDAHSCIFGPDCYFPCRCENTQRCNNATGTCNNGGQCKENPTGFHWWGPGCQIGNIAHGKQTFSNTNVKPGYDNMTWNQPEKWMDSSNAVDGNIDRNLYSGSCTLIRTLPTSKQTPAWWMVDLGHLYYIYNVTIINYKGNFLENLRNYRISYANDSSTAISSANLMNNCGIIYTKLLDNITLSCYKDTKGFPIARFIAVINGDKQDISNLHWFPTGMIICEFIVMGHKYQPVQWHNCIDNPSNNIWCIKCQGGKPPDCTICPAGYYGEDCSNSCSVNKYGYYCNKQCNSMDKALCEINDNFCRFCQNITQCLKLQNCALCQKWYIGDMCQNFLSLPQTVSPVDVISTSNTSMDVKITFNHAISNGLTQYYTYKLKYNTKGNSTFVIQTVPYVNDAKSIIIVLTGLKLYHTYQITLELCRKYGNWSEECQQSKTVEIKLTMQTSVNVTVLIVSVVGAAVVILSAVSAFCEIRRRGISKGDKDMFLNMK